MAKIRRSMGERTRRWKKVTEHSALLIADMPELAEAVGELREVAAEILDLEFQQTHHLTAARTLTAKINALAKRADHLRGRLGASLRGKHGFDNPVLSRYGFRPREWVKKDRADRELAEEREARAAE
jgi:hypothetical protein